MDLTGWITLELQIGQSGELGYRAASLDNIEHHLSRVNIADRLFLEYADLNDQISLVTALACLNLITYFIWQPRVSLKQFLAHRSTR